MVPCRVHGRSHPHPHQPATGRFHRQRMLLISHAVIPCSIPCQPVTARSRTGTGVQRAPESRETNFGHEREGMLVSPAKRGQALQVVDNPGAPLPPTPRAWPARQPASNQPTFARIGTSSRLICSSQTDDPPIITCPSDEPSRTTTPADKPTTASIARLLFCLWKHHHPLVAIPHGGITHGRTKHRTRPLELALVHISPGSGSGSGCRTWP